MCGFLSPGQSVAHVRNDPVFTAETDLSDTPVRVQAQPKGTANTGKTTGDGG
jgi:hypothetical protein